MHVKIQIKPQVGVEFIDIPVHITGGNTPVDNSDEVREFLVEEAVSKSLNPIVDYDKMRFTPVNSSTEQINNLKINLNFSGGSLPSVYSELGFDNQDIIFRRINFTQSQLILSFYDSDVAFNQNLVFEFTLNPRIYRSDLTNSGQPLPVNQIPVSFKSSEPQINVDGNLVGYYLFDYKGWYSPNTGRSLYMRAKFINRKTGKTTNFGTTQTPLPVSQLLHKLYVKYDLLRTQTGYTYSIDQNYSNNVSEITTVTGTDLLINLYELKTL